MRRIRKKKNIPFAQQNREDVEKEMKEYCGCAKRREWSSTSDSA
jgi:hypothetical protein